MRRVLLLAAALLPLCGLFAEVLSESAGAVVFRQPDGKAVTLRKKPERVVACYASFVQVWYAAGENRGHYAPGRDADFQPAGAKHSRRVSFV